MMHSNPLSYLCLAVPVIFSIAYNTIILVYKDNKKTASEPVQQPELKPVPNLEQALQPEQVPSLGLEPAPEQEPAPELETVAQPEPALELELACAIEPTTKPATAPRALRQLSTVTKKKRQKSDLTKVLLQYLECPVCHKTIEAPIRQCNNGHLLCSRCRRKLQNCPTCRCATFTRNLVFDRCAESLTEMFLCRHYMCTDMHLYKHKAEHEEHCLFRPFICPIDNICPFQDISDSRFTEHLRVTHSVEPLLHYGGYAYLSANDVPNELTWVSYAKVKFSQRTCFFIIWTKQLVGERCLICAQFVGSIKEAKNFQCKLEMTIDDENAECCSWEGNIRSVYVSTVKRNRESFILLREVANKCQIDERFKVKITITDKKFQNNNESDCGSFIGETDQ